MNTSPNKVIRRCLLSGLLLAGIGAAQAALVVSEEEWYDPTDWFDGDGIDYEYEQDYYDYDYDPGYYDYDYDWGYYDHYDDYDWDDWDNYRDYDFSDQSSTTTSTGSSSSTSNQASGSQRSSSSVGASSGGSATWDDNDWAESSSDLDDSEFAGTWYTYSIWVPAPDQSQVDQSQTRSESGQATSASSRSMASSSGQQQREPSRVMGTIEGLKSIPLTRKSGARGTFTIAKISLQDGGTAVVNLGRQSRLEDVNLKKGDKIRAVGQRGSIQDSDIFVAQKLEVNGREIDANPAIALQGERMTPMQSRQAEQSSTSAAKQQMAAEAEISGRVASTEKIKADASPAEHTLLQLTLQDGTTKTVDLGPGASLEKIDLEEGDSVTVRGHEDTIGGRQVIVAELMRVEGERVESVR